MGGSSKSSTSSSTENTTNNVQTESGVQIVNSDGASIITTDHDSVELSFDAINATVSKSLEFGEDALEAVADSTEQLAYLQESSLGTLKDFAENLSQGDLKTTKVMYLAGGGLVGLLILAYLFTNQAKPNKKAST